MASTEKTFRAEAIYPIGDPPFTQFPSRRSVVHSTKGMVACTQPLASEAGQRILKMGGNAAVCSPNSPYGFHSLTREDRTPLWLLVCFKEISPYLAYDA